MPTRLPIAREDALAFDQRRQQLARLAINAGLVALIALAALGSWLAATVL